MDQYTIDKFNDLFDDYLELEDQKTHVREGQKALKEEMASVLDENKSIVGKVISYLIKQRNKGEDELETVYDIVSKLEG